MFGYALPLYSRLKSSDLEIYRRFYCESCHQLKNEFGLVSTSVVNYDMTFNLLILDQISGGSGRFEGTPASMCCIFKKPKVNSKLFRDMAGYTLLLTKWELEDDRCDNPSMKTEFIDLVLSKAIQKAEKMYPEYDQIVGKGFENLRRMESEKCQDPVKLGREFGKFLSEPMEKMVGGKIRNELKELFTSLTASVYVMDAIDDLEDDFLDETFNPFLVGCPDFTNRSSYMSSNLYRITDLVNGCVDDFQKAYSLVKPHMAENTSVTDNIVFFGVPESAKNAILGTKTAKMSVKNALTLRKERTTAYRSASLPQGS